MTDSRIMQDVRDILTRHITQNHLRKTPERFAVLEAAYTLKGPFTLSDLDKYLKERNFPVSRATLYNTLRLLMRLRLVIYHRTLSQTFFEASYAQPNHVRQICSVCGTLTEIDAPGVVEAVAATGTQRFRKEGFSLYIYGVCSTCQARITRRLNKLKGQM